MQNQNQNKILDEETKLNEELEGELEIKDEKDLDESESETEQDKPTDENEKEDLSAQKKEVESQDENDDVGEKIEYVKIQLLKIESQAKQALKYLEGAYDLSSKTEFVTYKEKSAGLAGTKEQKARKL